MGTLTLWIAFNAGVALFLLLDLGLFNRRPHAIGIREAAIESLAWVGLSVGFGLWIFFSHGRGPGLEFFTGYVIEKSLSIDNIFVFILIFQFFRVDPRFQHRLLFWGVLGALVMRGAMIGVGAVLIEKFSWMLYIFGAFLLYAGIKLFSAEHSVHPENNPVLRWAQKILPMSQKQGTPELFVKEGGRWLVTQLFLVIVVLETTDLVFALDSIPAIFGVTRDPFLVYSSNVCAILGLRAFYFLLAGILPYFQYLDEGLAVVLMFIGGKMLVEPWLHISTGISLAIVGGIIIVAVIVSVLTAKKSKSHRKDLPESSRLAVPPVPSPSPESIRLLTESDLAKRARAAQEIYSAGVDRVSGVLEQWRKSLEFCALIVQEQSILPDGTKGSHAKLTVGIAVSPETFVRIREACGSPPLADAPRDQDVVEFELEFPGTFVPMPRLDVLTTNVPGGNGTLARFLNKFGEGIQQVEIDVTNVDRATDILSTRFKIQPIYAETRPGANGTRVNFFLVATESGGKVLVELVEQPVPTAL